MEAKKCESFNMQVLQARIKACDSTVGKAEESSGARIVLLGSMLVLAEAAGVMAAVLKTLFAGCKHIGVKDASEFKGSFKARRLAGDLGYLPAFDAEDSEGACAGIGRASWKFLATLARDYFEAENVEAKEGARICFGMALEDALVINAKALRSKYVQKRPVEETPALDEIKEKLEILDAEGLRVVAAIVVAKVRALKAAQEAAAASNGAEVPADVEAEREAVAA